MNLEKKESALEMSQEEYKLWNELDIYGYSGKLDTLRVSIGHIHDFLEADMKDEAAGAFELVVRTCEKLRDRIKQIDITHFDKRFPLDVIKRLTEQAPLALEDTLNSTRIAYEQGNLTPELIKEIQRKTDFMVELGKEINTNIRYEEYRMHTKESERK